MKNIKWWLTSILLAVVLAVPLSYAVWPTTNVDTTDLDSDTDSPLAARADLYDLATKFNQVRVHVTTYIQGLLDDADATAARSTLGLGTMATQNSNSVSITGGSVSLGSGTLVFPGATTPAQTSEGSAVWDTDGDLLTVGTGSARKTLVNTDSTQTLTNKTISGGTFSGTITNSGTISGGTLSGTITNSGTISGGTISGVTLSGTITNSGTISGGTLSGTITNSGTISGGTVSGATLTNPIISNTNVSPGIEWGSTSVSNTPYIDFHSSGNNIDYDSRIIASGGDTSGGNGTLTLNAATVSVSSAAVTSTRPCATGYTRLTPNYCIRSTNPNGITGLSLNVCTAVAAPSVDAKAVVFDLQAGARTENAIGLRQALIWIYGDSGCSTTYLAPTLAAQGTENPAYGNQNFVDENSKVLTVYLPTPGATVYLKKTGGANAFGVYTISGYYD